MPTTRFFVSTIQAAAKSDQPQASAREVVVCRFNEETTFGFTGKGVAVSGVKKGRSVKDALESAIRECIDADHVLVQLKHAADIMPIFDALTVEERDNVRIQDVFSKNNAVRFAIPASKAERDILLEIVPLQSEKDDIVIGCLSGHRDEYIAASIYVPGQDIDGLCRDVVTNEFKPWKPRERIEPMMTDLENRFPNPATMAM